MKKPFVTLKWTKKKLCEILSLPTKWLFLRLYTLQQWVSRASYEEFEFAEKKNGTPKETVFSIIATKNL